ncbi:MAG: hypothetical protein ACYTJ0_02025 [Planctomycetota bacterium]|jgi:hypothetical protein
MPTCELCERDVPAVTRHHLIPRSRHHNKRNRRTFGRTEVHRTLMLCRPCHGQIHAVLANKQLEHEYNSREKLIAHPEILKFVRWIRRRDPALRVAICRSRR